MKRIGIAFLFTWVITFSVRAEQPQDFLTLFATQAKLDNAGFSGFDASRGEQFFKSGL